MKNVRKLGKTKAGGKFGPRSSGSRKPGGKFRPHLPRGPQAGGKPGSRPSHGPRAASQSPAGPRTAPPRGARVSADTARDATNARVRAGGEVRAGAGSRDRESVGVRAAQLHDSDGLELLDDDIITSDDETVGGEGAVDYPLFDEGDTGIEEGAPRALVRLNKYLADHGVASRRKCDELIATGKVSVDGDPVHELGLKIDPMRHKVEINGFILKPLLARRRYYLLNKPSGVVCTNEPRETRPRAVDLVTDRDKGRIYTIGRLDEESKGLILLTNDGEFANRIMHPRFGVEKTYVVKVQGLIEDEALQKIREGVHLSEGRTAGARILVMKRGRDSSVVSLTLNEGMNREIRRVFARVGSKVLDLRRTRIGTLTDRGLKAGRWRELTRGEVADLRAGKNAAPTEPRLRGRPMRRAPPHKASRPWAPKEPSAERRPSGKRPSFEKKPSSTDRETDFEERGPSRTRRPDFASRARASDAPRSHASAAPRAHATDKGAAFTARPRQDAKNPAFAKRGRTNDQKTGFAKRKPSSRRLGR